MTKVTIKVREHGPLLVTGEVDLVDHLGRPIAVSGADIVLCRCGRSRRKPFCDGSHRGTAGGAPASADGTGPGSEHRP